MTLPNDSILVTPGTGATVATHLVSGKEYEVVMVADSDGHIVGSKEGFTVYSPPTTNAANRSVIDLFNADAAVIVSVRGIWIIPSLTAITGVQIGFDINRTTSVGTGGTALTPRKLDTSQAALDVDITARNGATGGAALDHIYWASFFFNDETNPGAGVVAYQNQLPVGLGGRVMEITLRQNQGIQVKQSITATVGLTGALIYFVVE